jgi:NAD(P)-dependent dehydrogenase (short-subunit alcohol dehydrogenase family)
VSTSPENALTTSGNNVTASQDGAGEDSEVASPVAYLASPESSFIAGSLLAIDRGYTA